MTRIRLWISAVAVATLLAVMVGGPAIANALTNLPLAKLSSI